MTISIKPTKHLSLSLSHPQSVNLIFSSLSGPRSPQLPPSGVERRGRRAPARPDPRRSPGGDEGELELEPVAPAPAVVVERRQRGRPGQTALLVRRPHRHGDPGVAHEASNPLGDLRVHHGQVSILREEQEGVAELDQAQSVAERVFR